jgi:hypothetical protein
MSVLYTSFPRTAPPPSYIPDVIDCFADEAIHTPTNDKGLTSDNVLAEIFEPLSRLGFELERGKRDDQKIKRPVFFGENGRPSLQYEVDGYHQGWRCGIEIEAGRAWMGNAVYRDLIQALIMVNLDHLILAVPQVYKYKSGGKSAESHDYRNTIAVAEALFGHTRITMPFSLTIVGY